MVDLHLLGERTITIDCDVIQADGGTRCAAITGSAVALAEACNWGVQQNLFKTSPLIANARVAAVSVGLVNNEVLLDLNYEEDSSAQADMNVVMNSSGGIIEIQTTAEQGAFTEEQFLLMLDAAKKGIHELIQLQNNALEKPLHEQR